MSNLAAEMARYGVSAADIQNVLGCTDKTVKNKMTGATEFSVGEAMKIREAFFPGMRLEYLFAQPENRRA
ncbi:MAG: XRE family transcriptional regulator [Oscillospiraceae bacterium]|nr:XRE family transcriptional regulator [Oscillospiraceae bacterium]